MSSLKKYSSTKSKKICFKLLCRISDFVNEMNENEKDELMVLKFIK